MDGTNMNAGDFLLGKNASMGLTNYLGASAGYLSTGGSGLDVPTNFSFLQVGLTIDSTLLYSNAGANMTSTYGTQIGIYNVNDPSQKRSCSLTARCITLRRDPLVSTTTT